MELVKKEKEYSIFTNLLKDIEAPRKVIRRLNHAGAFNYDTENVKGRLSLNDNPYFTSLQEIFFKELQALGFLKACKPSYNFLMQYLPGSEMFFHKDRPQCKFNFALQITGEDPFFIDTERGREEILLKPNTGILYSGTDNEHGLKPQVNYRAAVVFHFVDINFKGSLK